MLMAPESEGWLQSLDTRSNQSRGQRTAILRGIDKYVRALRKIRNRSRKKVDDLRRRGHQNRLLTALVGDRQVRHAILRPACRDMPVGHRSADVRWRRRSTRRK